MKKIVFILIALVFSSNLFAQGFIDNVLAEIEKNNTSLSARRKSADAEKLGNRVGLTPQNPEVEFNYLWGNPSEVGNRADFAIRQTFDFPTAYSHRSQISDLRNNLAELEYKKHRNEVLHQARMVCIKLIYHNALDVKFSGRVTNAQQIADAYKAKFNIGEVGVLDFNNAQLNLLNAKNLQRNNEIERDALLLELAKLNGGVAINFTDSLFPSVSIPADFEQRVNSAEENNPLLQWVRQETEIASKEIDLNRAMNLPKFYGGFIGEVASEERFWGVSVGITIPLWENRNVVNYARARSTAIQGTQTDAKAQFYSDMKTTHNKVVALQTNLEEYRSSLALFSNRLLLETAFNKGEISLTEYIHAISLYNDNMLQLLEMEKNLNLAFAELMRYQQ